MKLIRSNNLAEATVAMVELLIANGDIDWNALSDTDFAISTTDNQESIELTLGDQTFIIVGCVLNKYIIRVVYGKSEFFDKSVYSNTDHGKLAEEFSNSVEAACFIFHTVFTPECPYKEHVPVADTLFALSVFMKNNYQPWWPYNEGLASVESDVPNRLCYDVTKHDCDMGVEVTITVRGDGICAVLTEDGVGSSTGVYPVSDIIDFFKVIDDKLHEWWSK